MDKEDEDDNTRPTTPKWWRPPVPPETYLWEEVRRKRERGGYPWTLLHPADQMDDNVYEPVNAPLFGSGILHQGHGDPETSSLDCRMLDIPPDIEIVNSEGLDGLNEPDNYDFGIDGDKEWHHFVSHDGDEESAGSHSKTSFTAGIRNVHVPKIGDNSRSRPLVKKDGEETAMVEEDQTPAVENPEPQSVPEEPTSSTPCVKKSAFDRLKSKADKMKQKMSKISLPVRPKFNQWKGIKLSRKKTTNEAEDPNDNEEDQVVPEKMKKESVEAIERGFAPGIPTHFLDNQLESNEPPLDEQVEEGKLEIQIVKAAEDPKLAKAAEKERKEAEKARKEAETEKLKKEAEEEKRIKCEERAQREKEAEEKKKAKAAQKEKEAEEQRRLKEIEAEEVRRVKEEQKRLKEEALIKKQAAAEEADAKRTKERMERESETEGAKRDLLIQAEEDRLQRERDAEEGRRVREAHRAEEQRREEEKLYENEEVFEQVLKLEQQFNNMEGEDTGAKKEKKRKFMDLDFTKRFKRSKTPPPRPDPPKKKPPRKFAPAENQLASQYAHEISGRVQDLAETQQREDPQILITQPSVDTLEEEEEQKLTPAQLRHQQVHRNLDKIGGKIKGFGQRASQTSKGLGQKMKGIGANMKVLGVKLNEKCQSTILRQEGQKKQPEEGEEEEPKKTFRFKGRKEPNEGNMKKSPRAARSAYIKAREENIYENNEEARMSPAEGPKVHRSQLLGRADRDWESPLDLVQSREASEEPGNFSSRAESPPGSSMASSSLMRRPGVLEEIDSDEFFLRERGISEGEDAEEVNRFLVEELRQAFRPTMVNALSGFDYPPMRPTRSPKKPPRKDFQTFPPERPKRKTAGYISAYLNQQESEEKEEEEEEELTSMMEDEDEGLRRVKEELKKIDDQIEPDDRYEPVNEQPERPSRAKRKKEPKDGGLYYNTIAANEWMREPEDVQTTEDIPEPRPPKREKKKSEKNPEELEESNVVDLQSTSVQQSFEDFESRPESNLETQGDDSFDYIDDSGYAFVQKEPKTVPRKKKQKSGSLKRRSQEMGFFSLPRYTPRTFHIVPPSRPHRTYSTVKPKRPPRRKGEEEKSPVVGMQGRPLPPPPRPHREPPTVLNDLDQSSLERLVGARHYANMDEEMEAEEVQVVQEILFTSNNIPILGRSVTRREDSVEERVEEIMERLQREHLEREMEREMEESFKSDINVGVQTDPFQEYEEENNQMGSFDEEEIRITNLRSSVTRFESDERENEVMNVRMSPIIDLRPPVNSPPPPPQPQFTFPSRIHFDELEVDLLRVTQLNATSLNLNNIQSPVLHLSSLTSTGPLNVPSIRTDNLDIEEIHSERLSASNVELPSIPPQAFYNLAPPHRSLGMSVESEESDLGGDCPEVPLPPPAPPVLPPPRPLQSAGGEEETENIGQLSFRLGRAIFRVTMRSLQAMAEYLEDATSNDPEKQEKARANMQVLLCLLLILVAGIILAGRSGPSAPRWEFFMPPPDL